MVDDELKRVLPGATTYSLRRNCIHRIIEFTGAPDGQLDFGAACRLTLHFCPRTLVAYYQKKAADYHLDGEDELV